MISGSGHLWSVAKQKKHSDNIYHVLFSLWQEQHFEDTKFHQIGVISHKSKDRQHNSQTIKDKRTNNDLQNTTLKTKRRPTPTPVKPVGTQLFRVRKKKSVITNTGNCFCFNSNVSNLYNNDVIIYKIQKSRDNSFVC